MAPWQGSIELPNLRSPILDSGLSTAAFRLPSLVLLYIGLLVPRDATIDIRSDASYAGVGGWSPTLNIMWRVMREDLLALGFPMKRLRHYEDEPLDGKSEGLHIKPLEFLGAIINLWLLLKLVHRLPRPVAGHIADLLSDNTSCLSWCRYTTIMKDPYLQPWARFVATLLVVARQQNMRVQPTHITGVTNIEADYLSHSDNGQVPSWGSATEQCFLLRPCQICLLPHKLFSTIANMLSSPPTEAMFGEITTQLLTLEPVILPIGSRLEDTRSSLLPL